MGRSAGWQDGWLFYLLTSIFSLLWVGFYCAFVGVGLVLMLLLAPFRWLGPEWVRWHLGILHVFSDSIWGIMLRLNEGFGGWTFNFYGDEIPPTGEDVFVVTNHRFWLDWATVFQLAARSSRLGCCKLFAKKSISYVPFIGWGLQLSDYIFLSRDWLKDQARIQATFQRLRTNGLPFWIISHLEGTRMAPDKLKESQDFLRKTPGRRVLQYCLAPRTKGFCATIQALRERLDAIYDLTIVYDGERMASPGQASLVISKFLVRPIRVDVHIRRFPIDELPHNDGELADWVAARWDEKDLLLEAYFKTGSFPNPRNMPLSHRWFQLYRDQMNYVPRMVRLKAEARGKEEPKEKKVA